MANPFVVLAIGVVVAFVLFVLLPALWIVSVPTIVAFAVLAVIVYWPHTMPANRLSNRVSPEKS